MYSELFRIMNVLLIFLMLGCSGLTKRPEIDDESVERGSYHWGTCDSLWNSVQYWSELEIPLISMTDQSHPLGIIEDSILGPISPASQFLCEIGPGARVQWVVTFVMFGSDDDRFNPCGAVVAFSQSAKCQVVHVPVTALFRQFGRGTYFITHVVDGVPTHRGMYAIF